MKHQFVNQHLSTSRQVTTAFPETVQCLTFANNKLIANKKVDLEQLQMYKVKRNQHKSNLTFQHTIFSYKTTSSTLTTSTQKQSTENTDGRHQQKIHDNYKHYIKNYFSGSSSLFRTAFNSFFNSRLHQSQVHTYILVDLDKSVTSRSAFF